MLKKFVLTAFCEDRPGIVADISEIIYKNECNLEDSTMTNLAGEFAIILLFSPLSAESETDLEERLTSECRRLEREKGITAFIRPASHPEMKPKAGIHAKNLYVEGQDHAGIVYKVSRFLADNDINIAHLKSDVKFSPESGAAIYNLSISVEIPHKVSLETVEQKLHRLEEELHVHVTLE
ncbi:MAG: ACT domain-containing protein [Desulfobacteraceae bacterium]|nr:ACT domain-containing protein [Desulfobacteraceae bacterium]